MKSDDKYNGFANYETWVVSLWLDNEEGSYRYWREAALQEKGEAPQCWQVAEHIWTADQAAKYRLADRLKDEVGEGTPDLVPSLYGDLLDAALESVDWHEVAETFLEE